MEYASRQHSCLSYLWPDLLGHHLLQTVLLTLPQSAQGDWKMNSSLLPDARALWAEETAASSQSTVSMLVFVLLSGRTWNERHLEHSYRSEDRVSLEWNLEQKRGMEITVRILFLGWSSLAAHLERYFDSRIYFQGYLNWFHRHLRRKIYHFKWNFSSHCN